MVRFVVVLLRRLVFVVVVVLVLVLLLHRRSRRCRPHRGRCDPPRRLHESVIVVVIRDSSLKLTLLIITMSGLSMLLNTAHCQSDFTHNCHPYLHALVLLAIPS